MNWELFLAAVAIGATTELLTLTESIDGYRRAIAVPRLLAVAVALALVIPADATVIAVTAFALPHIGRILGEWLRWAYLKVRIGRETREWHINRRRTSEEGENTSATPS